MLFDGPSICLTILHFKVCSGGLEVSQVFKAKEKAKQTPLLSKIKTWVTLSITLWPLNVVKFQTFNKIRN